MVASIGCGILSPSCEVHIAPFKADCTNEVSKYHIVQKNVLKSLTNALERIAVNTVTNKP